MTLRAVLVGFGLGLFISAFTLFHDNVIRGSWLISNHLPIAVFGAVVLLLLAVNPALSRLRGLRPLGRTELAVVAAIGFAACGWPSFGFFQGFLPITGLPDYWTQSRPAWQANQVMSYVPGASPEFGYGHVRDWPGLARALVEAEGAGEGTAPRQVWLELRDHERRVAGAVAEAARSEARDETTLLYALNRIVREAELAPPPGLDPEELPAALSARGEGRLTPVERARLNRWLLVRSFPEVLLPMPEGWPIIVAGGEEAARARQLARQGDPSAGTAVLGRVPWPTWWPVLRLWGGLGLLLGVAALCLALVVHPQWSRHELLTYPLARFFTEISEQRPGGGLPAVAYHGLFWLGVVSMLALHGLNGLSAWLPGAGLPKVPLRFDLTPLRALFPAVTQVPNVYHIFSATFFPSVVCFAFFLNVRVAFSVGIAPFAFAALGMALLSRDIVIEQPYIASGNGNLMRFGAYLAMGLIIAYVGRRYYAKLAQRALGLGASAEVPAYAAWAARGLGVCVLLSVALLCTTGLSWHLASLFVLLVLLMYLVLTRIVVETGLFFVQSWWMPVAVLSAVFGMEAIGPTSYIVLGLGSVLLLGDPRCVLMPYLANGLQMVEESRSEGGVRRVGGPMLAMVVVGFFVAGLAAFALIHTIGMSTLDSWATEALPTMPFDQLSRSLAEMRAEWTLAGSTAADGLRDWRLIEPEGAAYAWIGLGAALVAVCAAARLRFTGWPIHPVVFLIWGTMPSSKVAASFLLGWLIKLAIVQNAGTRGYRAVLPLVVGVIAGELLAALGWTAVGVVCHLTSDVTPPIYRVYP